MSALQGITFGSVCAVRALGALALIVAAVLQVGCTTAPVAAPSVAWSTLVDVPRERDFRQAGPTDVDVMEIAGIATGECQPRVIRFKPRDREVDTPLIFAHGFLRSVAEHEDFARHLASWGVTTYLVGLCSGGWNRDAANTYRSLLRGVADTSGAKHVIYGGFSAGGLASGLAALDDSRAVGYLGLDPVDRAVLARHAAKFSFPIYGLFAPANRCNAQQVGRGVFAAAGAARALEVAGATHCNFEAPSDFLCALACGDAATPVEDGVLRMRILAMSTAYVRWRAGLDPNAGPWWQAVPDLLRALPRQTD